MSNCQKKVPKRHQIVEICIVFLLFVFVENFVKSFVGNNIYFWEMDYLLLFIGLLTLSALGYTIFKLNNKSEQPEDLQRRMDEINQMKEILTLEFKNLANEILDEKTKKIGEVNKENL